jgi:uncharacterized membrane protein
MSAVFYAVIAAVAAGFYSYFQRLASPNVNQLFGALAVSAAALAIAALFLVPQLGRIRLFINPAGMSSMWFLLGAGAAAFQSTTLRCKHIQRVCRSQLALPSVLLGELQPRW